MGSWRPLSRSRVCLLTIKEQRPVEAISVLLHSQVTVFKDMQIILDLMSKVYESPLIPNCSQCLYTTIFILETSGYNSTYKGLS